MEKNNHTCNRQTLRSMIIFPSGGDYTMIRAGALFALCTSRHLLSLSLFSLSLNECADSLVVLSADAVTKDFSALFLTQIISIWTRKNTYAFGLWIQLGPFRTGPRSNSSRSSLGLARRWDCPTDRHRRKHRRRSWNRRITNFQVIEDSVIMMEFRLLNLFIGVLSVAASLRHGSSAVDE